MGVKIKYIVLFLFIIPKIIFSQTNVEISSDIEEYNHAENINLITFEVNNNLKDVTVIHCDSIKNKSLLPSKYHKRYLKERIVGIDRQEDTLIVSVIGLSDCCSNFIANIDYINDTLINLKYKDIGNTSCFCGNCPYLFTYFIIDNNRQINNISLNSKDISQSNNIYINGIDIVKIDSLTGNKIIETYDRYVNDHTILLKRYYNKEGILLDTKTYYQGEEVYE